MKRREFITLLGGAGAAWSVAARGQQAERMKRIGVLMGYAEDDPAAQAQIDSFGQELHRLGWTLGRNLQITYRYGSDDPQRIRALAKELLRLSPDLVVSNANFVTAILKSEAGDVPLVFVSVSDPVGSGLVTNLARPTGSVTGFANFEASMGGKWLETLKEIVPQVERVGFILHPDTPPNVGFLKAAEAAAPTFNVRLTALNVRTGGDRASFHDFQCGRQQWRPHCCAARRHHNQSRSHNRVGGQLSTPRDLFVCLLRQSWRVDFLRDRHA